MRSMLRVAIVAGAALWTARPLPAADDPAKEYAALEEAFETAPLEWPTQFATFRPKYEAFAKAHPGTDAGMGAKMRLLEFAATLKDDEAAMHAEASRRLSDVLAEDPRSPRLAELAEMWYLFTPEDWKRVSEAVRAPDQADAVKASVLLQSARVDVAEGKLDEAEVKLQEVLAKYRAVPHGGFTFGELADSLHTRCDPSDVAVRGRAPEIAGTSVDGKPVKLSDLRGRVVLVCFFNGGFGSGKDTYAEERKLADTFKAEKFTMLFVSATSTPVRMRAVAKHEKLTWPTIFDGRDGPVATRWRIAAWPSWFLLDRNGFVRRAETGSPAPWTTSAVAELLAESKPAKK